MSKKSKAQEILLVVKGGPGSGNWGHTGRPGKRGGSGTGSGGLVNNPKALGRYREGGGSRAKEIVQKIREQKPLTERNPKRAQATSQDPMTLFKKDIENRAETYLKSAPKSTFNKSKIGFLDDDITVDTFGVGLGEKDKFGETFAKTYALPLTTPQDDYFNGKEERYFVEKGGKNAEGMSFDRFTNGRYFVNGEKQDGFIMVAGDNRGGLGDVVIFPQTGRAVQFGRTSSDFAKGYAELKKDPMGFLKKRVKEINIMTANSKLRKDETAMERLRNKGAELAKTAISKVDFNNLSLPKNKVTVSVVTELGKPASKQVSANDLSDTMAVFKDPDTKGFTVVHKKSGLTAGSFKDSKTAVAVGKAYSQLDFSAMASTELQLTSETLPVSIAAGNILQTLRDMGYKTIG